jgi:hypothetical protein
MLSALSFITLLLVWLCSLLNIWHRTPQRNRATLVIHPEAEWDFRCRSNTASRIGPAASMDVCMGHFDLPSVNACEDLEQGLVVPYPLEIVGYVSVAPVLGSTPNFHVSISSIPSPSRHMVSGDHISYEDDQYITAQSHTLGNGRHTIFVRGRAINKITGPSSTAPLALRASLTQCRTGVSQWTVSTGKEAPDLVPSLHQHSGYSNTLPSWT